MKSAFQKVIAGDETGLPVSSDARNYRLSDIILQSLTPDCFQIFFWRGKGYFESDSKVIYFRNKGETFSLDIELEEDVKNLRLDPGELPVILGVKGSYFVMEDGTTESIFPKTNGRELSDSLFVMDNDLQLQLTVPSGTKSYLMEFFFDKTKQGMVEELIKSYGK